ncbi:hypothetical protein HY994_01710 [Candidatus Micrarchaeota archaeon]|nr:hypothetical protein [Candidatus Micrarchaeota archaeon]
MAERAIERHDFRHLASLVRDETRVRQHNMWDNIQVLLPSASEEQLQNLHKKLEQKLTFRAKKKP